MSTPPPTGPTSSGRSPTSKSWRRSRRASAMLPRSGFGTTLISRDSASRSSRPGWSTRSGASSSATRAGRTSSRSIARTPKRSSVPSGSHEHLPRSAGRAQGVAEAAREARHEPREPPRTAAGVLQAVLPEDGPLDDRSPNTGQQRRGEPPRTAIHERQLGDLILPVEGQGRQDPAAEVGLAHPVPGEPHPVVSRAPRQGAEPRVVSGRDVHRPAPALLDRDVVERGEDPPEPLGHPPERDLVVVVPRPDPRAQSPAHPPEGDPAVGRGPEVVEGGANVADGLAAGPAELLDPFGGRGGEHDVAPPDHQRATEPRPPGRPGVRGDHGASGPHQPLRGLHLHRAPPSHPAGRRALVDPHPSLQEDPPQSPGQTGRLDGGPPHHRTRSERW